METTWLCIVVFMFIGYAVLDGMDFGAGIIHLFVARDEREGMLVKRTIGPFWDGNEVWIVAGGGLLFMAFPRLYASIFSGMYLPLMLILWLFIGRGLSLELRNQLDNDLWRRLWDGLFGVSSLLLALLFGIAFGNMMRGVNLGGVENGVSAFEPSYFFSPLWTDFIRPENPGIIDWFSLLIGVIAVLSLTIHGGNWVILKIDSQFAGRVRRFALRAQVILAPLLVLSFFAVLETSPAMRANFVAHPGLVVLPLLGVGALVAGAWCQRRQRELAAFLCSGSYIALMFIAAVAASYPVLLPSTNAVHPSLTVFNAAAPPYSLAIGLRWWILGIALIAGYSAMVHWLHRGKMARDGEQYHSYH